MKTITQVFTAFLFILAVPGAVAFAEEVKEKPADVNAALGLFPPAEKVAPEKSRAPAAFVHVTPSYDREATTHVQ